MAKISNYLGRGLHADRPAAGAPGALYCEADTGSVLRDNGTSWDVVATTGGALDIVPISGDTTLTHANVFVVASAAAIITLPPAAACAGQMCLFRGTPNPDVRAPAGEATGGMDGITTFLVSDGTQWWTLDF